MDIRTMTIEDYEGVYRLWTKTPGMGLNDLDDSRDGIDRYLRRNPHTCFIAMKNDGIIGTIICGHDGRRGYIYHTAVAEDQRGHGVGSALLIASLDALGKEGIHKVALVVFNHNIIGNDFWEKREFNQRHHLVYRNKTLRDMGKIDT